MTLTEPQGHLTRLHSEPDLHSLYKILPWVGAMYQAGIIDSFEIRVLQQFEQKGESGQTDRQTIGWTDTVGCYQMYQGVDH